MKAKYSCLALLGVMTVFPTYAVDNTPTAIINTVTRYLPGFNTKQIAPSPIPGLYMLRYGPNIFYMSEDGHYMVRGEVIDIVEGTSVTEEARKRARIDSISSLREEDMIVYSPETVDATVTVFTDISCPYCARFHQEVRNLNENGIKVRYLAYPRVGIPSPVADDMASIWCANDPKQAFTDANAGLGVEPKTCQNPIKDHYAAGNSIGVTGTPTIVLDDGSIHRGYIPYLKLIGAARQAKFQNINKP